MLKYTRRTQEPPELQPQCLAFLARIFGKKSLREEEEVVACPWGVLVLCPHLHPGNMMIQCSKLQDYLALGLCTPSAVALVLLAQWPKATEVVYEQGMLKACPSDPLG